MPGQVSDCQHAELAVGLPARGVYQGNYLDTKHTEVDKLMAFISNTDMPAARQREQLDLLKALNDAYAWARNAHPQLEAWTRTFELAFRMQSEATDAFDLTKETKETRAIYGDTTRGRQLFYTRWLIEREVRFVQVWSGAGQPWGNHDNLEAQHKKLAGEWDQLIAAFLADLKRISLIDKTLFLWGGEFGRTPVAELPRLKSRGNNHYGFT